MKVFQIEEPDGSPADPEAPGAAVGIDVSAREAAVAIAVGGNAVVLNDRDGFELQLTVPSTSAAAPEWRVLLERARLRAERALARPMTHAVVVADGLVAERVQRAATEANLVLLRVLSPDAIPRGEMRVLAAAVLAEDLAPRPRTPYRI